MNDPTLVASPIICMGFLLILWIAPQTNYSQSFVILSRFCVYVKILAILSLPRMIWKELKLAWVATMELHGQLPLQLQKLTRCKLLSILQPIEDKMGSWFYAISSKIVCN